MEDTSLMKKDFEEFTKVMLLNCMAMMTTILNNQCQIISKLENVPAETIADKMNEYIHDDHKRVLEAVDKKITVKSLDDLFYVRKS